MKNPNESENLWNDRFYNGIDLTERKSINFTNIKFDGKKKSRSSKKTDNKKINGSKELTKEEINEKEEITEKIVPKRKRSPINKLPFLGIFLTLVSIILLLNYLIEISTLTRFTKKLFRSVNYLYNSKVKPFEPFKKILFLRKSKWLRLIRDFNIYLSKTDCYSFKHE